MEITSLYVYGTGDRADGMTFAVGAVLADGPSNGSLALFQHVTHAHLFARTMGEELSVPVSILPSAEINMMARGDANTDAEAAEISRMIDGDPWRPTNI